LLEDSEGHSKDGLNLSYEAWILVKLEGEFELKKIWFIVFSTQ
jgi:hypothetical protein